MKALLLLWPHCVQDCKQFLQNDQLAADPSKDIFITIWIKRDSFLKVNNLSAYLNTMSRNLALTYLKDMAKEVTEKEKWAAVLPVTENETEQKLNRKTLGKILEESINQLPPQQKRVFSLAKLDGLSYGEIARELNISPHCWQHILRKQAVEGVWKSTAFLYPSVCLFFSVTTDPLRSKNHSIY